MDSGLLLSLAKDGQVALAGIIIAVLAGIRWWWSFKRGVREDAGADASHKALVDTVKLLREENGKLWESNNIKQKELDKLYRVLRKHNIPIPKE